MRDIRELSDVKAESGVIGTLIENPGFIEHFDVLKPNHFSDKLNQCLYWGIKELTIKGIKNIDAYNLNQVLSGQKGIAKVMDELNVPNLEDSLNLYAMIARDSLEEYLALASKVVEFAFKRELYIKLDHMGRFCFEQNMDLEALSNKVYDELDGLTESFIVSEKVNVIGNKVDEMWNYIQESRNPDGSFGIASKFAVLKDYFSYQPKELIIIEAQKKRGKSMFVMNEAVHKAQNGIPTLIIDTEMDDLLFFQRMLSHISGVSGSKIRDGKYTKEEEIKLDRAMKEIKELPLIHIYNTNMTMESIYSLCKVLKRTFGLSFVVYDYIKSNETSTGENYNILGAMTDYLKNKIAGELQLSVLAACQLNRDGKVADSDKIERYASCALTWKPKTLDRQHIDGVECGNFEVRIPINRIGTCMVFDDDEEEYLDFYFDGDTATISEAKQHRREKPF